MLLSFLASLLLRSRPERPARSHARAKVALFARYVRIRGGYAHEGESYVHTRTRVTSCPRSDTPPIDRPPFGIPSKHPPRSAPLSPFRLLPAPTTPGLFLRGSSIAPNHPHLPSCLSVPLKTPESSPNVSLFGSLRLSSPSLFPASFARPLLGSLGARAIKLHARQAPFESRPAIEINFCDRGMTPDVTLASPLLLLL